MAPDSDPSKKYQPRRLPKIESYTPPESMGDKIAKKILDQSVKQGTGIGRIVTKSPIGISTMLFSEPLNNNEMDELERLLEEMKNDKTQMCR